MRRNLMVAIMCVMGMTFMGCGAQETAVTETEPVEIAEVVEPQETIEDSIEEEVIDEPVEEVVADSSEEVDSQETATDPEPKSNEASAPTGVYSSETSYVSPLGRFNDASGNTIFISMFTDETSDTWVGNIEGSYVGGTMNGAHNNGVLELIKNATNIYHLADCDFNDNWKMYETSLAIAVDNGGNTIRLYDNGVLIDTFERDMSFDPNSVG